MTIFEQLTTDGRFEAMSLTRGRSKSVSTSVNPTMDKALHRAAEQRQSSVAAILREAIYAWLQDNS